MAKKELSQYAKNAVKLYKGGNPDTIEQLLRMQDSSVVVELMEHFQQKDIKNLAIRLMLGE